MSKIIKEEKFATKAQRDSINKFAEAMLAKLELRSIKNKQGSLLGKKKDHSIWFYFQRLKGETNELQRAIKRHDINCDEKTCDAIISEACDVANFAAAIAEKAAEDTR